MKSIKFPKIQQIQFKIILEFFLIHKNFGGLFENTMQYIRDVLSQIFFWSFLIKKSIVPKSFHLWADL